MSSSIFARLKAEPAALRALLGVQALQILHLVQVVM